MSDYSAQENFVLIKIHKYGIIIMFGGNSLIASGTGMSITDNLGKIW